MITSREALLEKFRVNFRTEYICLKCKVISDEKHVWCHEVQANGRICGGPICPRIIRVYKARGDVYG